MNRQHIRPVVADIQDGDSQLPAMVGYIRQLVDIQDSRAVAHNAATAYLALIMAFSDRGLLEVAWAPRLLIEVDNQEFEIILDDPEMVEMAITTRSSDQVSHSLAIMEKHDRPRPLAPVKGRLDAFLTTIATKDWSILANPVSTPFVETEHHGEDTVRGKDRAVQAIVNRLLALQALERKELSLSVATNIAYWKLGEAYSLFVESKGSLLGLQRNSRAEQKAVFDLLCNERDFQAVSNSLRGQWTLKKRLQRARKYLLLVSVFGTVVLHAAPEVSVTRLDALRLTDLWQLAEEGAASGTVQDITRQLSSRLADPACLEGTIQEAVSTTVTLAECPPNIHPGVLGDGIPV